MRKRAVRMILTAVTTVSLLLGVPGALGASTAVWISDQQSLQTRADTLLRVIDRRIEFDGPETIGPGSIESWSQPVDGQARARTSVTIRGRGLISAGNDITGPTMTTIVSAPSGTSVRMEVSAIPTIRRIGLICALFIAGMGAAMIVGGVMAARLSRRLSAPLIYLAAQAEQIGSGQVRARVKPSGIEEIDLVQEELVRTGERMAGRLAAERQFAADASHQLRTPLTALSMRLEEIEMISTEAQVRDEARTCLEQVERMTAVVSELLDTNARAAGQTEAIHILEVFNAQREEWEEPFDRAGRPLVFLDEAEVPVLADGGKLSQVLATLIENSLHYGAGTTRVLARASANKRGVVIEVSDEGDGVDESLAPDIFLKGVSGYGSTGIGLALATDLTNAMGGRLELAQTSPPVFAVSLAAIPAALDPDRVMPEGPVVSMGRRSRRF
ncbi:ATP-binding protein [Actinomyces sp. B33]|uniref:ATP-binding protein n=1 Tax=Actinomyces sp. B33 TaxID=2942131 RepID=UPI0023411DB0|nr:ATP-binding protein [Actinomyces sp. B33]MDC4232623.1 ATP-binding protein [Actinomyces sp. B33]